MISSARASFAGCISPRRGVFFAHVEKNIQTYCHGRGFFAPTAFLSIQGSRTHTKARYPEMQQAESSSLEQGRHKGKISLRQEQTRFWGYRACCTVSGRAALLFSSAGVVTRAAACAVTVAWRCCVESVSAGHVFGQRMHRAYFEGKCPSFQRAGGRYFPMGFGMAASWTGRSGISGKAKFFKAMLADRTGKIIQRHGNLLALQPR